MMAWKRHNSTSATVAFVREPVGSDVGDIWTIPVTISASAPYLEAGTATNRTWNSSTTDDTDPDW